MNFRVQSNAGVALFEDVVVLGPAGAVSPLFFKADGLQLYQSPILVEAIPGGIVCVWGLWHQYSSFFILTTTFIVIFFF